MIPRELQDYQQWVCWTRVNRTQTKLPISPATGKAASCTDPASWGGYRQARAAASRFRLDGIGFVFTIADPYTGVDLDHCRRDQGELEPWAAALVERLDSYTEWSPSGEGVHILVKASLPEGAGRRTSGIEIYSSGRYFTITGDQLHGTPSTIDHRQGELLGLVASLERKSPTHQIISRPTAPIAPSDEELIQRAQRARNGAKFQRLWTGDTSDYAGDHSRADAALCSLLAYYANGEQARIDRLFRRSGLFRQKWDRPTAGSTYGSRTIQSVVRRALGEL